MTSNDKRSSDERSERDEQAEHQRGGMASNRLPEAFIESSQPVTDANSADDGSAVRATAATADMPATTAPTTSDEDREDEERGLQELRSFYHGTLVSILLGLSLGIRLGSNFT